MTESCTAAIAINGFSHACHCDAGHAGPHVTRVKVSDDCYDGFSWEVRDGGAVTLDIPRQVSASLFFLSGDPSSLQHFIAAAVSELVSKIPQADDGVPF